MKISGVGVRPELIQSGTPNSNTVLSATSSLTGDMIDMGSPGFCPNGCSRVVVEHLHLDGAGQAVTGIVNNWAQGQSYVSDVSISNVGVAGLTIGAGAANSGPYSNLNITNKNLDSCSGGSAGCPCVNIETQTRGFHGITCIGLSSVANTAGINVNASNNTIEDVHIETFSDGIEVGNVPGATVSNITLSNIVAGNNNPNQQVQNVIHICGQFGTCQNHPVKVSDVTILQARYSNSTTPPPGKMSLLDDVTGTSIPDTSLVGLYGLGQALDSGFSRFNTSPTAGVVWGVGNAGTPGSCTTQGALYSNTTGSSGSSIYVCGVSLTWLPIV